MFGAEIGWLKVDYDCDEELDMQIWYEDLNSDGFIDCLKYDFDGDENYEQVITIEKEDYSILDFNYEDLSDLYKNQTNAVVTQYVRMIFFLKEILAKQEQNFVIDDLDAYYARASQLDIKIMASKEAQKYYQDLILRRYWWRLTQLTAFSNSSFQLINVAYLNGDFEQLILLLEIQVN